jgi:uncharacterized protein
MSESSNNEPGTITWVDLTVQDAVSIRDFYTAVAGWGFTPVKMGEYEDFAMTAHASGMAVSGICHARGVNADLPPQWLIYITVEDLEKSMARCVERGGRILAGPKSMGGQGRYGVIQDPAGAVAALFAPAKTG